MLGPVWGPPRVYPPWPAEPVPSPAYGFSRTCPIPANALDPRSGSGGSDPNRVNRGGRWNNDASNMGAAGHDENTPSNQNNNIGFRCLRDWP